MRTCRSCYRCWVQKYSGWENSEKRRGKSYTCSTGQVVKRDGRSLIVIGKVDVDPRKKACDRYRSRRNMCRKARYRSVTGKIKRAFQVHVRFPLGGLRKPVPLEWVDGYDHIRDRIKPNSEPKCPHCGEMPYSTKRCVFCGQRFTPEGEE